MFLGGDSREQNVQLLSLREGHNDTSFVTLPFQARGLFLGLLGKCPGYKAGAGQDHQQSKSPPSIRVYEHTCELVHYLF